MRILAFDTSSSISAVSVVDGDRVLAEDDAPSAALHGETLVPRIRAAMQRAGLAYTDLDLVAVGVGPGSFTGLRVGLATAKGLALAAGVALRGVDSLAALARGALEDARVGATENAIAVTVVDAHRGEVFVAAYARSEGDALRVLLAPACAAPEAAAALVRDACAASVSVGAALVCGDAAVAHGAAFVGALGGRARMADAQGGSPRGRFLAAEARSAFAREGASDLATLEPFYLRQAEVTLPSR